MHVPLGSSFTAAGFGMATTYAAWRFNKNPCKWAGFWFAWENNWSREIASDRLRVPTADLWEDCVFGQEYGVMEVVLMWYGESAPPMEDAVQRAETGESLLENSARSDVRSPFKRKTLRLGKYLLEVKIYGKCLNSCLSKRKHPEKVEIRSIWLFFCKEGKKAVWSLIFGWKRRDRVQAWFARCETLLLRFYKGVLRRESEWASKPCTLWWK